MKIYLDTSDLLRAYKGASLEAGADAHDKELFRIITAASEKHEICLSFNHLTDICHGKNLTYVLPKAQWIDSIQNKLWFVSHFDIKQTELRSYLLGKASGTHQEPHILGGFLGMFRRFKPEDIPNVINRPTVAAFVQEALSSQSGIEQFERMREASIQSARTLAEDRRAVAENGDTQRLETIRRIKVRRGVLIEAMTAHRGLV